LFILPTLLLAVFIGSFAVAESRKMGNDERIRLVIEDPVTNLAHRLEHAAWRMESIFESYKTSIAEGKNKDLAEFKEAFVQLKKNESMMSAYLLLDQPRAEDYLHELDQMTRIRENMRRIDKYIGQDTILTAKSWSVVKDYMALILADSHNLGTSIKNKHQQSLSSLLKTIAKDENHRTILTIFIFIVGIALILVLLDIVYHFKSNAERAQAAERYNALFAGALHNTRVGVLIRDMQNSNHPVVYINEAFTVLTGYKQEDLVSENSEFLFGWNTASSIVNAFRRTISLHETSTFDCLLYRKDGSPFWVEWHLSPMFNEKGEITYYVSLFNDISAFRQAQEELIQAKALAERASAVKTSFLAMMSHEIRTPINGILGVIRLMMETNLDKEQQHLLGIARTSSNALHSIINDILDYAKMEAGRVEIVDEAFSLSELVFEIEEFGKSLLIDKGVRMDSFVMTGEADIVVGDPSRLRQILLNLLSNAIKFTDQGTITVRVLSMMEQQVKGLPGVLMRFEVQDSGIGINPDDQSKLFQEFNQVERSFSRRYGGTGLGLAICRRLVAMMGGEIGVESQVGTGSKFWFMIPMRTAQASDLVCELPLAERKKNAVAKHPSEITILLAEDNETNRLVAKKYLEKIGFHVDEAVNGVQAVNLARAKQYDLILMDVSMPEMDGMMASFQIRAIGEGYAQTPIIALTAHVMAGDRDLCLSAGMNDYLNKPIDYDVFIKTLDRWLHLELAHNVLARDRDNGLCGFPAQEKREQGEMDRSVSDASSTEMQPALVGTLGYYTKKYPLFDPTVLERMRDTLGGDVVQQVTDVFLKDSKKRIAELDTANDYSHLQDLAHTMKSCCGNCGLTRLSHAMADLEAAAGKGDIAQIREIQPLLMGLYQESIHALLEGRTTYFSNQEAPEAIS
jgi:PAS domain S-box-containing protein